MQRHQSAAYPVPPSHRKSSGVTGFQGWLFNPGCCACIGCCTSANCVHGALACLRWPWIPGWKPRLLRMHWLLHHHLLREEQPEQDGLVALKQLHFAGLTPQPYNSVCAQECRQFCTCIHSQLQCFYPGICKQMPACMPALNGRVGPVTAHYLWCPFRVTRGLSSSVCAHIFWYLGA
eukprot:1140355-Pelagomonas_calceolata.AAC.13